MQNSDRPVALVTGAAYGIGSAAAERLARAGFDLAITEIAGAGTGETEAAVRSAGGQCVSLPLDLRSDADIATVVRRTSERFGRIDVLVNNAGAPSPRKPAIEVARTDWDEVLSVSLLGTFFMSQQVAKHLMAAGKPGRIISLASTHGLVGFSGHSVYGIAKAGIAHMTRMLAIEWAEAGICVNAVAPGGTETKSRAAAFADPVRRKTQLDRIPLGRFGQAAEVAEAIAYLASPQAAYVTGQVLVIDGGLTAA